MRVRKNIIIVLATLTLSLSSVFSSFAGQWKEDEKGKWYEEDGNYITSSWKEIEGKQYYFGADGYMLVNTTTPDGYKVGADGVWIQDGNTAEVNNTDYYEEPGKITVTSQAIFHARPYAYNNGLYCCNLDGTNDRFLLERRYDCVEGVDEKVYCTEYDSQTSTTRLHRFSTDGTIKEEGLCTVSKFGVNIIFADTTGIQLSTGYYDIASGQYIEGLIKEKRKKDSLSSYVPQNIKELVPHNDYDSIKMLWKEGDYVNVGTYAYNSMNSWMSPYDMVGDYIINTKTRNCVAYCKWEKGYKGQRAGFGALKVTELGLMSGTRRIEDGGRLVELFDKVPATNIDGIKDYTYKIIGTTIYYMNGDYDVFVVNNLTPAPLPTSEATAQAN